jgi:hypothetical protein
MSRESEPKPEQDKPAPADKPDDESFWSAYWERFRRQEVDDPVEDRREGIWERFQRQTVDEPVRRRSR